MWGNSKCCKKKFSRLTEVEKQNALKLIYGINHDIPEAFEWNIHAVFLSCFHLFDTEVEYLPLPWRNSEYTFNIRLPLSPFNIHLNCCTISVTLNTFHLFVLYLPRFPECLLSTTWEKKKTLTTSFTLRCYTGVNHFVFWFISSFCWFIIHAFVLICLSNISPKLARENNTDSEGPIEPNHFRLSHNGAYFCICMQYYTFLVSYLTECRTDLIINSCIFFYWWKFLFFSSMNTEVTSSGLTNRRHLLFLNDEFESWTIKFISIKSLMEKVHR